MSETTPPSPELAQGVSALARALVAAARSPQKFAADGSPMLTSQAAAVVAACRHLVGVVDVLEPARHAEAVPLLRSLLRSYGSTPTKSRS